MNFGLIISKISVLFLILLFGYFLNRKEVIDDYTSKKLSSLVVNYTAPFLIIHAMIGQSNLKASEIFTMLGITMVIYFAMFLMTLFVPKLLRVGPADIGIYKFMLVFSNVAFMGFPVVSALFGDTAVFYAAIINLPFNLLAYTLGIYFVSMNTGVATTFKWKKMINSGVLSVFVGLFLLGFGIVLPNFMQDTIGMIGGLTTPLSMLVIGASLAHVKMKTLFTNKRLYVYCLIRLIIFPGLVYLALTAFGIEGIILGVAVVLSGMPAAANTVMMSKEYGGNDLLAAEGVFISTMLSAITIPLLALLLT
ncbi:MAG: AEC family transporter [Vallitaleaceae bacterium]|nr:AEC family transporter [Vallitaleaceae bacterium]